MDENEKELINLLCDNVKILGENSLLIREAIESINKRLERLEDAVYLICQDIKPTVRTEVLKKFLEKG
jgi:hypothetical protein